MRSYNMWIKRKDYDQMVTRIGFLENQLCPNGIHDFKEIDSYLVAAFCFCFHPIRYSYSS